MKWFVLCVAILCMSFGAHKFYVSKTLVNHNAVNQTVEITIDIFTDDLEFALQENRGGLMRLGSDREHADADYLIEQYLLDHLKLWIDDRKVEPIFLGKDVQHDLTYCFFEVGNVQDFHTFQLKNDILCEMYDEQSNIVDLKFGGWSEKLLFTRFDPIQVVTK